MNDLDLIGIYEIAELAGVSPPAVVNWRTRSSDFPNPVVELKSGPVFRRNDIEHWLKIRNGERQKMGSDGIRIGLRLLEFECGVAANIDDANSAELVDYELSRSTGQSARLAGDFFASGIMLLGNGRKLDLPLHLDPESFEMSRRAACSTFEDERDQIPAV